MSKEYKISMGLKRGQEYTLSVQLSSDSGEVEAYLGRDYYIGKTKDQKITFTMDQIVASRTLIVNTLNSRHSIIRIKLEKGSKATDWTRAPEDDREYITSQIEISSEEIKTTISNDTDEKISKVTQTVDDFKVDIGNEVKGVRSSIEANAKSINLRVLKRDFNGYNIATQITLDENAMNLVAENIDLTGKVTFSSFDFWTKKRISDVEDGVDDAKEEAQEAKRDAKRADGWRYENTTEIDGGKIKAQTISANDIKSYGTLSGVHISGGTINIGDGNFRVLAGGALEMSSGRFKVDSSGNMSASKGSFSVPHDGDGVFNDYTSTHASASGDNARGARWKYNDAHYIYQGSSSIAFYQSGQSYNFQKGSMSSKGILNINAEGGQTINLNPGSGNAHVKGHFYPRETNTYWLGRSGLRWHTLYLRNGTSESSDARLKKEIQAIPEKLINFFKEVEPKMYEMDGVKQFGYVAQDVERALFKYATETYGIETARRNKEVFNMVGKDDSYLALIYRQVSAIKDAEKDNEIAELKERLSKLEKGIKNG